jgi:hypothetical protein
VSLVQKKAKIKTRDRTRKQKAHRHRCRKEEGEKKERTKREQKGSCSVESQNELCWLGEEEHKGGGSGEST